MQSAAVNSDDRSIVQALAEAVSALAREPRMAAILRRWQDVNALRRPDRAPVWCKPVGCWEEIIPESSLRCSTPFARSLEMTFRQILFKRELDDDTPVGDTFQVNAIFAVEPANTWGVDVGRHHADAPGGAWAYDPPIKDVADLDRLRIPEYRLNEVATRERLERIEELVGDVLPVRLAAAFPLDATIGSAAAELRGLETMMMDMIAEPELMHRLMATIRDAVLSSMRTVEASGLLVPNRYQAMTCSDPVGDVPPGGTCTARNLWCMANSQEFDQVSPAMWEEFCLAYQMPILTQFGHVAYGCCENLTHKIDGVLTIPNLRIVVCSAWSDLDTIIGKTAGRHCIMWRQKASDVVFPDDPATVRQDLFNGARRLQGTCHQIVLRELETLAGHPDRLHVWTQFAKEAAGKYN
jgi:hypothetical protein